MMYVTDGRFDSLISLIFLKNVRSRNSVIHSSIFEDDNNPGNDIIRFENKYLYKDLSRRDWFSIVCGIMLSNRNEVNRRKDGTSNYGRVLLYKDSHISFASKYMGLARLKDSPYLSYLRIQDDLGLLGFSPISIVENVLQKNKEKDILFWTSSKNGDKESCLIYKQILEGFKKYAIFSGIGFNEELFDNVVDGIMPDSEIIIIKPKDLTNSNIKSLFKSHTQNNINAESFKVIKSCIYGLANDSKYTDENHPNFQFPQISDEMIKGLNGKISLDLRLLDKKTPTRSFSNSIALSAFENINRIIHSVELRNDGMYGLLCGSLIKQYPLIGEKHPEIISMVHTYKVTDTKHSFVTEKYGNLQNTIEHFIPQSLTNSYKINPHNPKWMLHMSSFDHKRFTSIATCDQKCDILLRHECMSRDELKSFVNGVLFEFAKETEFVRCGKRIYREISSNIKRFA